MVEFDNSISLSQSLQLMHIIPNVSSYYWNKSNAQLDTLWQQTSELAKSFVDNLFAIPIYR